MRASGIAASLPRRLARLSGAAKAALGFFALAVVAAPLAAHADFLGIQNTVVVIIINTLAIVVNVLGQLLVAVIQILIQIVQYNDFLRAPAVDTGWEIIRDIGNMFFIVVLIMIAFGSILRIQGYRYNQWLFRIVLMALLVNFSKTIAGFFIDVAQVVTLTFVNAFKDTAAGNFAELFGITKILGLRQFSPKGEDVAGAGLATAGTFLLAILFLLVALAVSVVYVVIFLLRIIVLWFLVILSPMAYVLNTFKQGESYAKQWWNYFGQYLVVGPLLAFFLWLALTLTTSGGATTTLQEQLTREAKLSEQFSQERVGGLADVAEAGAGDVRVALSAIGSTSNILNFIAGIALLVGALGVASRLRFAGGQLAANVRTRIGRGLSRVGRSPYVQGTLGLATGGLVGGAAAMQALARTGPVRRVGQRVGYDVADATLGAVGRVPIIGAAARRARSRLAGQRFAEADKLERDVKYATPRELFSNSNMIPIDERTLQTRFKSNERLINQNLFKAAGAPAAAIPGVFQRFRSDGGVQLTTESAKRIQVKQYDERGNLVKDKNGQPVFKTLTYDARSESSRNPDVKETLKKGYETNPAASLSFEDYRRAEERDRAAAVEARLRPRVDRLMRDLGVNEKEARNLIPKETVEGIRGEEANRIQYTHRIFSGQSPRKIAEMSSDNATNEPLMRALATHVYTEMKKNQRNEFTRFAAPDILAATERFRPPQVEGEDEGEEGEGTRKPSQPPSKEPQPRRPIFDAYGRPYEPEKEEPKEEERKAEEKEKGREKPEEPRTRPQQTTGPAEPGQPPPAPSTAYLAGEPPYSSQQREQILGDLGKNVRSLSRAAEQIADAVGGLRANAAQIVDDPQRLTVALDRLSQEVSLQRQKSSSAVTQDVLTSVGLELNELRKRVTQPTSPFEAELLRKRLQDLSKSFQPPPTPQPPGPPPPRREEV